MSLFNNTSLKLITGLCLTIVASLGVILVLSNYLGAEEINTTTIVCDPTVEVC